MEQHKAEWAGSSLPRKSCVQRVPDCAGCCPPGAAARSPVLLGVVDYGPDLQLPVDLWPPKLLQLHLLGKTGEASAPGPPIPAPALGGGAGVHEPKADGSHRI